MSDPIDTRPKLRRRVALLLEVESALLSRRSLRWGQGERVTYSRMLRDLGLELVTRTGAAKSGQVVKARQVPVAIGYFGAPIQLHAELYIAGIQTKRAA